MQKKVFFCLVFLTACFIIGGIYITESINLLISRLEFVTDLHQVELLRKELINQLKIVQTDLLLKDSPHARQVDTFVQHGEELRVASEACFGCHHAEPVSARLDQMEKNISSYLNRLSRVYTIRANAARLNRERQIAFIMGQQILEEVSSLAVNSSEKTSQRIALARNDIADTRHLIIVFVTLGPIAILIGAYLLGRRFADSVSTLIQASRKIEDGDLSYQITEKFSDEEFNELAVAFNEMARSLREQRDKLEFAQKRYRILFESASDAIFLIEAEGPEAGLIVSANHSAAEMHGYTVEELLQYRIQDLEIASQADAEERLRRLLAGERLSLMLNHRRKDGTVFPVEVSANLLEVENHRYVLAFDRDISERVRTQEMLQRSKQMAMVGQMAAGLAHEIKNPLAGIKLSMEVLVQDLEIAPEEKEIFQRIIGEVHRIEKLLVNLLSYARPPEPQCEPVDLNRLLEQSIQNAEFSLKSPNSPYKDSAIRFLREYTGEIPLAMGDSSQLQQVFLNLLLNAVDAISGEGTITVRTGMDESGSIFASISDSGKGVSEELLARIFQPFFTTKPRGTGLGLAISRRLVEQQQGTISVVNPSSGGATFTISLIPASMDKEMRALG